MPIGELLRELDARWSSPSDPRKPLRIFGSTALMLQTAYHRGTTDSDVLESATLDGATKAELLRLAGVGTELARRHGVHLQIVNEAIPFLPQPPRWHPVVELATLHHFEVTVLDVVDVVVSKLKRFEPKDRDDILAMVDHGLDHRALVERFEAAVDWCLGDARAADLPRYVEHLHVVEREYFGRTPTEIVLPSWI